MCLDLVESFTSIATVLLQVGRVAKIMGASALHAIPASTPLGVMQNPPYAQILQKCQVLWARMARLCLEMQRGIIDGQA